MIAPDKTIKLILVYPMTTVIAGSVTDDEARTLFRDWEAPKPYIRIVPQPD